MKRNKKYNTGMLSSYSFLMKTKPKTTTKAEFFTVSLHTEHGPSCCCCSCSFWHWAIMRKQASWYVLLSLPHTGGAFSTHLSKRRAFAVAFPGCTGPHHGLKGIVLASEAGRSPEQAPSACCLRPGMEHWAMVSSQGFGYVLPSEPQTCGALG